MILDLPIVGTLLYHIASSRNIIEESFEERYFYNPYSAKPFYIDHYFESAHLGECPKAVFSSMECKYTKCNIINALKKIDNSIFIVGGAEEPYILDNIEEYKLYNSAIESSIISKTKHLPQLENPAKLLDAISMCFA